MEDPVTVVGVDPGTGPDQQKTVTLGQSSFRDPLLVTLGELSDWRINRVIPFRETHALVCKRMGITMDQCGIQDSSKKPWVELWVGWAFRDLVAAGYASRKQKGQWHLTQAGVDQAMRLRGTEPILSEADSETGSPQAATNLPEGLVSFQVAVATSTGYAGGDTYLIGLATQQTPCFGVSYGDALVCGSCPLLERCGQAYLATLSNQAEALAQEEAKKIRAIKETEQALAARVAKDAALAAQAKQTPLPVVPRPSGSAAVAAPAPIGNVNLVTVPKDGTLCSKCHQPLAKGSSAYWVRTAPAGMYHPQCYQELVAKP